MMYKFNLFHIFIFRFISRLIFRLIFRFRAAKKLHSSVDGFASSMRLPSRPEPVTVVRCRCEPGHVEGGHF